MNKQNISSIPLVPFWSEFIGVLFLWTLGILQVSHATELRYSGRLSPNDYLFGSQEQHADPLFDNAKPIDLSATIGVGSDCGKINFQATLQSSLNNVLSGAFFADLGQDLVSKGAMLSRQPLYSGH